MADGILCKHCGFYETDHLFPEDAPHGNRRRKGYRRHLIRCSQFEGETEPEPVSDAELEAIERQGETRAAWGQYAALIRTMNFEERLSNIHDREKRLAFIEKCRDQNWGFYVG